MYFTRVLPAAAMLVTAISATPVHIEHSRRQLGDLTGILKGIMNLGGGGSSSSSNTGTTVPATDTATSADTMALQQCSDAISKIEAALSMSASYMKAAGGVPTPQEIQAVLIVLEQSLGADCDDDTKTRRDFSIDHKPIQSLQERSEEPWTNIMGDGSGSSSSSSSSGEASQNEPYWYGWGDCEEEEYCAGGHGSNEAANGNGNDDDQMMNAKAGTTALLAPNDDADAEANREDSIQQRAADTTSYSDSCSDCERQLYHIVKELQVIFALGAGTSSELPGMSASIAAVPTTALAVPLSDITNMATLTGTISSQMTAIPQAN